MYADEVGRMVVEIISLLTAQTSLDSWHLIKTNATLASKKACYLCNLLYLFVALYNSKYSILRCDWSCFHFNYGFVSATLKTKLIASKVTTQM